MQAKNSGSRKFVKFVSPVPVAPVRFVTRLNRWLGSRCS